MRLLIAASLSLFLAGAASADPTIPTNDIIVGAVDGYVRPAFAAFADDAAGLEAAMTALCAGPAPTALTTAQNSFKRSILSYARVEFLHFGPLTVDDRAERLLLWPDTKGIALKQVQAALSQQDPMATDPATLSKKSVAMQGFTALEFLLFGTGAEALGTGDAYRCQYGAAVATLISDVATTLDQEWRDDTADGARAHMLAPNADRQDYRTSNEVLSKLAQALLLGSETLRDQRLAPIVGASEGKPKPKSALFWRSAMTMPMLVADFSGLKDYFNAARFPEAVKGNMWIASGALFEFDNAIEAAVKVTKPIEDALDDPMQAKQLPYIIHVTRTLDTLVGENLSGALGLTIGFSGLDGD